MSDPFDRLRSSSGSVDTPPLATIKSRAARVQRRRYTVTASLAAIVLVLAGVGLITRSSPSKSHQEASKSAVSNSTSGSSDVTVTSAAPSAQGAGTASSLSAGTNQSTYGGTALSPAKGVTPVEPRQTLLASIIAAKKAPGQNFTLQVCNSTSSTQTRSFPRNQLYDFEVTTRSGSKVWQWSDNKSFPNAPISVTWKPKECKSWTEYWNGTTSSGSLATPGTYQVQGTMTSNPRVQSVKLTFCQDVCN